MFGIKQVLQTAFKAGMGDERANQNVNQMVGVIMAVIVGGLIIYLVGDSLIAQIDTTNGTLGQNADFGTVSTAVTLLFLVPVVLIASYFLKVIRE